MPPVSEAQRRAMFAAASGHSNIGIPKSVGAEFVASDKPGKLPQRVHKLGGGGLASYDNVIHFPRSTGGEVDPVDLAAHVARQPMQGGGMGTPWFERAEARELERPAYGFTMGSGGGRTDKNNVTVGAGAYVLPADVVSGLGEGNSMAGAAVIDRMFRSLPYGIQPQPAARHGIGIPRPPAPFREGPAPTLAKGGEAEGDEHVPIAAADGEIILHPDQVYALGATYLPPGKPRPREAILAHGHDVLDAFVKHVRGQTIKDLEELPGPQNSKNDDEGHKKAA